MSQTAMPESTPLSPAAQAVRKAYYSTDDDLAGPALAAALRATADQVVPYEASAPWNELKYDYDGDRWEMRQWVRDQLLAIAAELDAPTLLERALKGDAAAAKQFLHEAGFTDRQGQWLPQYQPIADGTDD